VATTGYTKNFVVKNGITTGPITLDASSGNIAGSNVSITANLSVTGVSNLGAPGNVKISGGTNGYVLSTDGSSNLSWVAQSAGGGSSISNGNSNVNIATSGGNVTISTAGNANIMTVTGTGANIAGTLSVSGTTNLGAVGNVTITGGSNGYLLSTNGSGGLSWVAQSSSNIVLDTFTGNGVQTVFTLTNSPTSEDYTIINIDGVSQLHSAYTVANANVTLSSAPANGAAIEVMTFNLGGGSGSNTSSGYTYVEATGNTTASPNTKYIVNTNTANLTITLPSTPSFGDEVGIIDGTGNASVHAITISRNGSNIQGAASSMTVTTDRSAFTLVYYNASQGWVLTNV
jgi:hypothetical protein